jgi:predicted  nucleic acid-binding Zn-ribbon protein
VSMIQNLIKKAFGTVNANEAASFLASACNRMKSSSKAEIQSEIEQALCGVNLNRLGSHDVGMMARLKAAEAEAVQLRAELKAAAGKAKTKTVYQDNPETLRRLAEVQSELAASRLNTVPQAELQRLTARIGGLQKNLETEREHHYQELALLRETLQRKMAEQVRQSPDGRAQQELAERILTLQQTLAAQKEQHGAELAELHETMQQDMDNQRQLRGELVKNGNALIETVQALQNQIAALKQQIHDTGAEGDAARTAYEQALQAHQIYINVLKNDIGELTRKNKDLQSSLDDSLGESQASRLHADALHQKTLSLQQSVDEMAETAQNRALAFDNLEAEVSVLRAALEQERIDNQHNYSLCETLSRRLEAAEAELSRSKGSKSFMRWITEK